MAVEAIQQKSDQSIKWRFYVSSLTILFCLLFVIKLDFSALGGALRALGDHNVNWLGVLGDFCCEMIVDNFGAAFAGICVGVCIKVTKGLDDKFAGSRERTGKITKIENEDFEYLTFLMTYIIPLVCLGIEGFRYWIVLMGLLTIIGEIIVKTEKYYANPSLALLGYRIYRAEIEKSQIQGQNVRLEMILITKDKLKKDATVQLKQIDENVWFAAEVDKNGGTTEING